MFADNKGGDSEESMIADMLIAGHARSESLIVVLIAALVAVIIHIRRKRF